MIKPDIIVSWPRNCDYPLWRESIRNNRDKFEQIIVVFTETNQGDNYISFVMEAMNQDDVKFLISPIILPGQDWRNIAVNYALQYSFADWVFFTEQDLQIMDKFWDSVSENEKKPVRVIAVIDHPRMHPCGILMHRDVLDELNKDFGIVTDKLDHFGLIQKQIEERQIAVGEIDPDTYYHMNGLSHNMTMAYNGDKANYKHCKFRKYLEMCLEVKVPLSPIFTALAQGYLNKYPCGE